MQAKDVLLFSSKTISLLLFLSSAHAVADEAPAANFESTHLEFGEINENSGLAVSWTRHDVF